MKSQSVLGSIGATRLRGAASEKIDSTRKTQQTGAVNRVRSVSMLSRQALSRLKERPRLIAELADSHRTLNSMMLAAEQLKLIARSLVTLKSLVEKGSLSPKQLNDVDIEKRRIMNAVGVQLFGKYILDSSFSPAFDGGTEIEFAVPGLDMVRERLTNELITLYINNRMIPLAFDRVESDEELFKRFAITFAYSHMRIRLDEQQALQIAMPDEMWRKWDLQVFISGQGGRYPEGAPITVRVQSLHPTVEMITMLDITAKDALEAIDKVMVRVNEMHRFALVSLKSQKQNSDKLIGFCHSASAETGVKIKRLFEQNGKAALNAIHRHYVGPNRENVISLIKK